MSLDSKAIMVRHENLPERKLELSDILPATLEQGSNLAELAKESDRYESMIATVDKTKSAKLSWRAERLAEKLGILSSEDIASINKVHNNFYSLLESGLTPKERRWNSRIHPFESYQNGRYAKIVDDFIQVVGLNLGPMLLGAYVALFGVPQLDFIPQPLWQSGLIEALRIGSFQCAVESVGTGALAYLGSVGVGLAGGVSTFIAQWQLSYHPREDYRALVESLNEYRCALRNIAEKLESAPQALESFQLKPFQIEELECEYSGKLSSVAKELLEGSQRFSKAYDDLNTVCNYAVAINNQRFLSGKSKKE